MRTISRRNVAPKAGPEMPIIRIKDTNVHPFTILSESYQGFDTHWDRKARDGKGESCPHYKPAEECPGCKKKLPMRWKGYLHVWDYHSQKHGFLEVTAASLRQVALCLPKGATWRGIRINVSRSSNSNQGRLRITVLDPDVNIKNMPQERDAWETLKELWRVTDDVAKDGDNLLNSECGSEVIPLPYRAQAR